MTRHRTPDLIRTDDSGARGAVDGLARRLGLGALVGAVLDRVALDFSDMGWRGEPDEILM
jgi:hypothetical protein